MKKQNKITQNEMFGGFKSISVKIEDHVANTQEWVDSMSYNPQFQYCVRYKCTKIE